MRLGGECMEVSPFVILLAMVFGIAFVLSKNWIYSSISVMDNCAIVSV
mgnify:CR=1 FL=1